MIGFMELFACTSCNSRLLGYEAWVEFKYTVASPNYFGEANYIQIIEYRMDWLYELLIPSRPMTLPN
jgi:hypothetical protein